MQPFLVTSVNPLTGWCLGVGVTAVDERDARRMALLAVGQDFAIAEVRWVRSIDKLDQGHVVPNMGLILHYGVWFPITFEHIR